MHILGIIYYINVTPNNVTSSLRLHLRDAQLHEYAVIFTFWDGSRHLSARFPVCSLQNSHKVIFCSASYLHVSRMSQQTVHTILSCRKWANIQLTP